jgi:hypothetical protein
MKPKQSLISVFFATLFVANTYAQSQQCRTFPFEYGTFVEEMTFENSDDKIVTTTYFNHWGDWKTSRMISHLHGRVIEHNTYLTIYKGDSVWEINLKEKKGTLSPWIRTDESETKSDSDEVSPHTIVSTEDLGKETYLGYAVQKSRIQFYSGYESIALTFHKRNTSEHSYVPFRMKTESSRGSITRIISLDLTPPPASVFEVPEGVTIETSKSKK